MVRKSNLQRYVIEPYGYALYIAQRTEANLKEIGKRLAICSARNLNEESETGYEEICNIDSAGLTIPVIEKGTGQCGVLVMFNRDVDIHNTIAHESVHVADYIWQQCHMFFEDFSEGNEPYAYIVGWVAGKISSVILKNKKK